MSRALQEDIKSLIELLVLDFAQGSAATRMHQFSSRWPRHLRTREKTDDKHLRGVEQFIFPSGVRNGDGSCFIGIPHWSKC